MTDEKKFSAKVVARLLQYRRALNARAEGGNEFIYSHNIATICGVSAAQVRRDVMEIGYLGSAAKGYRIAELSEAISSAVEVPGGRRLAVIGIGNLGRAILDYFHLRRPNLKIVAGFDVNPRLYGRVLHGVHCYPMEQLSEVIVREGIEVGLITAPGPASQEIAHTLIDSGVRGILNFAPIVLKVPNDVYVEQIDVTTALERVAYFTQDNLLAKGRSDGEM